MNEDATVLFANEAFYTAFATRDLQAMEDIWSKESEPTCVHPGWLPLVGRKPVMKSWRDILENEHAPRIACSDGQVFRCGEAAYVTCHEHLENSFLVATNIFLREAGAWKIVHHHSGAALSANNTIDPPQTLQ